MQILILLLNANDGYANVYGISEIAGIRKRPINRHFEMKSVYPEFRRRI